MPPEHLARNSEPAGQHAETGGFDLEIFESLAAAEQVWRAFEAQGRLTPYQRFDWLDQLRTAGADCTGRVAIVTISAKGRVVALLPLTLRRHWPVTSAQFLGTDQANADWIVIAPDFAPSAETLRELFRAMARKLGGIDLLMIRNQPEQWGGTPNPVLQLPHQPAASNLYFTEIGGAAVPYIESRVSARRRGNLRRGWRRIEETIGPVRVVRVSDSATLERVHAEFLTQRRERFAEMGLENIFETPLFRSFFRHAAEAGFDEKQPVFVAHALMAGDEIVATTWGTVCGRHYSLYINSTTSGPASRYSLMGMLIAELMDLLLAEGIETFDLGLGDFDYKKEWSEPLAVYNSFIPLSWRGVIVAKGLAGRTALKRFIKQTPAVWKFVGQVRRGLFRAGETIRRR